MEYSCKCCKREFGENRIKYEYHCTTASHKRKQTTMKAEMTPTDYLMAMVKTLTQQVQDLSGGSAGVVVKRESDKPLSFNEIIRKKLYTQEQVIDRKNTDMLLPSKSWTRFLTSAYKYNRKQKIISYSYKPIEIAANLLLTKFYETPQELLPIIVLNNSSGRKKNIAYYYGDSIFNVRTDIVKRRNIDLYSRIDMYLYKAFAQPWLEDKLKEIYRSLPIEIKNKVHYHSIDDNNISFLDFKCTCSDNMHSKCYRDLLFDEEDLKVYRYKNRELKNIDGGTFTLNDNEFVEFVQEFIDHIENHDYGYVYNEYRENRDLMSFDTASEECRYEIVDEVFNLVCKRCLFKKCDEDA